jgi:hypothetical protein
MRNSQRCVDQRVRRERLAGLRGDADVIRLADLRVVIGRERLVIEEPIDHRIDRHSGIGGELRRTRAKSQTTKYVFEHANPLSPGKERATGPTA